MGVCVAATITVDKVEEKEPEAVEILKTAETRARQFGHGGNRTVFFCVFLTINHSQISKHWRNINISFQDLDTIHTCHLVVFHLF